MLKFLIFLIQWAAAMDKNEWDPVKNQILDFKYNNTDPIGMLTTRGGAPVYYREATSTFNLRSLLHSEYFLEKITHIATEKIPERVVHAKGTGAFGYFQVTHDISHFCKAKFLSKVGKKTPIAVRFSTTQGFRGSSDLRRDTRGFAVKFYTEEGNLDIVGFNTPNPATFLSDRSTLWDIATSLPESIFSLLMVLSDMGIPASYTTMNGFGIHTFQVVNNSGVNFYVRFYFKPDAGVKNLFTNEAMNISGIDPDYLSRDFYRKIAKGQRPSWTLCVQILSESDIKKIGHVVFDVTTIISTKEFPLHPVGRIVLTENFNNYHAQVEQMAFCPSSLVPGILGAPDKTFDARRIAHRHAQVYRLGGNFKNIPVNCPFQVRTHTYVRDGVPPVGDNERNAPNYYPNSFHGAQPYKEKYYTNLIDIKETNRPNNFVQAAEYYNELKPEERARLIENLTASVRSALKIIQIKVIKLLSSIHQDLGRLLAKNLNIK
ncbi:catalase-like [Bicyclus anynana]|uniref:Catalase-like n=1 Tax=Bicyclus anynana TaxID=110368 RepID=A0ABM3LHP5_BICAN|nr:catalase-like [Bicyclus anynana]